MDLEPNGMTTTNLADIRRLSDLVTVAGAALLPLAADGIGRDSHGGRIADPEAALSRALAALEEAGALATHLRRALGTLENTDALAPKIRREAGDSDEAAEGITAPNFGRNLFPSYAGVEPTRSTRSSCAKL